MKIIQNQVYLILSVLSVKFDFVLTIYIKHAKIKRSDNHLPNTSMKVIVVSVVIRKNAARQRSINYYIHWGTCCATWLYSIITDDLTQILVQFLLSWITRKVVIIFRWKIVRSICILLHTWSCIRKQTSLVFGCMCFVSNNF